MTNAEGRRNLQSALWVAIVPGAVMFAVLQTMAAARTGYLGFDSHAYWTAIRMPDTWYTRPVESQDAYLYSPAFAHILWPLAKLPWRVFQLAWMAAQMAVLGWLLAPLGWRRATTLSLFFITEILLGNVFIFLAAALVLGVGRAPGTLALMLLTKVTPAVVGVWLLVRGEWRAACSAFVVTSVIVCASVLASPDAWSDWFRFLLHSAGSRHGIARARPAVALLVVVYAARTGRAWLLAPALLIASPVTNGFAPLAVLSDVPRLLEFETAPAPLNRDRGNMHGSAVA